MRRALVGYPASGKTHGRAADAARVRRSRPDRSLTQLAAIGFILVMLGAIQKKIFVWHTGFWGERTYGWHYDLVFVAMNLVIVTTGGGRFVLL